MKNSNFSDWVVAFAVVVCSAVLFAALAMALSGMFWGGSGRILRVNFHDVMGIDLGSQVKYAGAPAGKVSAIRMLNVEERTALSDPHNVVQIELTLTDAVPPLPSDITVSVSADTILSDKVILLEGGSPKSPLLEDGAVVQGISPTTFDKLVRNIDGTLESLKDMLGGAKGETGDVLKRVRSLLSDTQSLVFGARSLLSETKPAVRDVRVLVGDARQLIGDNKAPLTRMVARLDKASGDIEELSARANSLVGNNDQKLTEAISDLKVITENLKVTSTYTKILGRNLIQRPSRLIWGGKPPPLPSEQEILRARGPIKAD